MVLLWLGGSEEAVEAVHSFSTLSCGSAGWRAVAAATVLARDFSMEGTLILPPALSAWLVACRKRQAWWS